MKFDMIFFGGTGDLSWRKLMPAMFQIFRHGALSNHGRILLLSRQKLNTESYCQWLHEHFTQLHWEEPYTAEVFNAFAQQLTYIPIDATDESAYQAIRKWVQERPGGISESQTFFLATAPDLFASIAENLAKVGLNQSTMRIVLEKPLGHDLHSAISINQAVQRYFSEQQIFRIDHYLGKQSVQNLLALRFGNIFFEPLWRRESIASVQITIAEELGVEGRGAYYERSGALRDMVQNHLLQLLCIVAMEPPSSAHANAVRDEKLKVLRCLKKIEKHEIKDSVIRAQYRSGNIHGKNVPGYTDEKGVSLQSTCETFVALRCEIDNWRWSGVPFFLRTGKRLSERVAEIMISFRETPQTIFPNFNPFPHNRLMIRLQPKDEIALHLFAKASNRGKAELGRLMPFALDLNFHETFGQYTVEAYERLLRKIIAGRLDLFVRSDEQEAAWRWVMPILEAWHDDLAPMYHYAAGTWGPTAATALLARENTFWSEVF